MPGKEANSKTDRSSEVVNPAVRTQTMALFLSLFFSYIVFPQFPSWFCDLFPFISSLPNSYQYFTSFLQISLLVTPSLFEWLHLSLNVNSETPVLLSVPLSTKCRTFTFWKLLTGATVLHGLGFYSSGSSFATLLSLNPCQVYPESSECLAPCPQL